MVTADVTAGSGAENGPDIPACVNGTVTAAPAFGDSIEARVESISVRIRQVTSARSRSSRNNWVRSRKAAGS